jgi:hypothetical protein
MEQQDAEKVPSLRRPLFGLFGLSCLFGFLVERN